MDNIICPICEEGHLAPKVEMRDVTYRNTTQRLPLQYSECDACGSETATAEQTRFNKREMVAFKKQVDGLLTGEDVRSIRKSLELTQSQAARLFGGGAVAFSKYETDDVTQSDAMDKLLRVAANVPSAYDYLVNHVGLFPPSESAAKTKWVVIEGSGNTTPSSHTRPHNPRVRELYSKPQDELRYA